MKNSKVTFSILLIALFFNTSVLAASEDEVMEMAREVHANVMALDTHVDIPFNFASSEHMPADAEAQVNLQSMKDGGLDSAFFIVYVGQTERTPETYLAAKADALSKFDAIHRMVELYPDEIGLALTAQDAEDLFNENKLVALIGIENGFVIGHDLSLVERFYDLGARYMTLVHNGHNDIGDSAQPRPQFGDEEVEHGGLSDFGYQVVDEMNRLGMLVDISHVSRQTMMDATLHSKAPVIASHSSVTAVADHPRNMNDEQLLALKENGGVIQIVAFDTYVKEGGESNVQDFVDHIDYAVNLIGVEHVGIASDFGGGGGIEGWNDAFETFNVTLELVRRGYSEEEIGMIWSGNVMRILAEAENVAAQF